MSAEFVIAFTVQSSVGATRPYRVNLPKLLVQYSKSATDNILCPSYFQHFSIDGHIMSLNFQSTEKFVDFTKSPRKRKANVFNLTQCLKYFHPK